MVDAIEDLGIGPIEDLVFANGGWPLAMRAEDWYPANVSFQKILQNYVKMGAECPFFSITVEPDCLNNECGIILLVRYIVSNVASMVCSSCSISIRIFFSCVA